MKKFIRRVCVLALPLLLTACASTVVTSNPAAGKGGLNTLQLVSVDFDYAVKKSLDEFIMSPEFGTKKDKVLVVRVENIKNETTQENLDTLRLSENVMKYLMRDGRFSVTAAVGGSFDDNNVRDYRQLEKSDLFDQDTGAKGKLVKPDLSMRGEIRQSEAVSTDRTKQQLSYIFRLSVIDLGSGRVLFYSSVPIDKLGPNQNFSW